MIDGVTDWKSEWLRRTVAKNRKHIPWVTLQAKKKKKKAMHFPQMTLSEMSP